MFNEHKQGQKDSVEEFLRDLMKLVKNGQYKDTDEEVQDRLVIGLTYREIKSKLQHIQDLTLAKAVRLARKEEQVKKQLKEQEENCKGEKEATAATYGVNLPQGHGSRGQAGENSYGHRQGQCRNRGRSQQQSQGQQWNYAPQPFPGQRCEWCRYTLHRRKSCPASGQTCTACGKNGHFWFVCKSGKRRAAQDEVTFQE